MVWLFCHKITIFFATLMHEKRFFREMCSHLIFFE